MSAVVVVTTSYPRDADDAAGHFVRAEARALAAAGRAVTVLAPGGGVSDPGVTVRALPGADAFGWPGALARLRVNPLRVLGASRFVAAAARALATVSPADSILAHWLVPCAYPAALAARAPVEVVVHGTDAALVGRLPRAARVALVTALVDRGARFRFVSRDLRDRLARASTERLLAVSRVEPCPIDTTGVPPRAVARARLGLSPAVRCAVVVGRLVPSKRPAAAVRLALTVADRVVVVGAGPLGDELVRSDARVSFTGHLPRPHTLAWIAAADWLVSASRDEGAPTVIREARALGTRVLAVPCGDLHDWARADPGIVLTAG